jgi:hypothetical protein
MSKKKDKTRVKRRRETKGEKKFYKTYICNPFNKFKMIYICDQRECILTNKGGKGKI